MRAAIIITLSALFASGCPQTKTKEAEVKAAEPPVEAAAPVVEEPEPEPEPETPAEPTD